MTKQPIRKQVQMAHPTITKQPIYTLLIDGTNLLKISMVDNKMNSRGQHIGGVFQFLLQVKLMLKKKDWDFVYVFFDGVDSGILRYVLYPEYKANRDKNYDEKFNKSDYDKQINDFVQRTLLYSKSRRKEFTVEQIQQKEVDIESFNRQKDYLTRYFEELFIRCVTDKETEGDDMIAYYISKKREEEKIVIMSSDRDFVQTIKDDVCLYIPKMKKFITPQNHKTIFGYSHENALLKKIMTGDVSDNIKGVKGLGETTLINLFPEIKDRKMTVEELKRLAKLINEQRISDKKKPKKVCENIVNGITDGVQSNKLYEINNKIMNLSTPLLTESAKEEIDSIMYSPIDPEGRSFENLYKMIIEDDIVEFLGDGKFMSFFVEFKKLVSKETKYYENVFKKTHD